MLLKRLAFVVVAPLAFAACGDNGDPSQANTEPNALQPRTPTAAPSFGSGKEVRVGVPLPVSSPTEARTGVPLPVITTDPPPTPPREPGTTPGQVIAPPDCHGAACSDCGDGSFCDLVEPGHCQDHSAAGYCKARLMSAMCPMLFDPVCGCDGVTYANDCERIKAGVSRDFAGPCSGTSERATSIAR